MRPHVIYNAAANYALHAAEMARRDNPQAEVDQAPVPDPIPGIWERTPDDRRQNPYMFLKLPNTIIADGNDEVRSTPLSANVRVATGGAGSREGNLVRTIQTHLGLIDHMRLVDDPGRHEPGSGERRYPFLFRRIDEFGYEGWIGCEYKPATDTSVGLTWMKTLGSDCECPVSVIRGVHPGERRPAGKARRLRRVGICDGGATPPAGMPRPGVMSGITETGH